MFLGKARGNVVDFLPCTFDQTIAQLLDAHIHVWVLTGDKQETAINIGHSCKLLKNDGQIIILNTTSLDETRTEVNEHLLRLQHQNKSGK